MFNWPWRYIIPLHMDVRGVWSPLIVMTFPNMKNMKFRNVPLYFFVVFNKGAQWAKNCINYCMITNTIYINLCSALWHCNCQYPRSQCNCRRLDNKVWIPYDYGGNIWKVKGSPFVLEAYLVDTKVRWSPFSRRLFKMNFLRWKLLNFASNVTEIYCEWSS